MEIMIDSNTFDKQLTLKFCENVYNAIHNKNQVAGCLANIGSEDNMKNIIEYLSVNPNATHSEMMYRILEINGKI